MPLRGVAITGLAVPNAVKRLDGTAITSGTWTVYITKDGGTQTTIGGSVTHEGNGQWTFDLTASEMDAATIALTFVHTDASPFTITLITDPIVGGTAQAGASTTITLASGASATDNLYVGLRVYLVSGTGAGQSRVVTGYVGSTKVATVDRAWTTNPASGSVYALLPADADLRTISGAAVSTSSAQIGVNAVNIGGTAQTGRDIGASVLISSGTGSGQLSVTSGVIAANVTQFGGSAGTFASGRPEVNTSHIAGSAVSTSTAQIGVNVVNFGGSAGTFASGRPEVNATHWGGTAVASANVRANVVQVSGQTATAAAGVTFPSSIGTSTYAGADTSGTTTLLSRLTATRAGYLDNLSAGPASTLDAAGIRTAIGMASADLDTQLDAIAALLGTPSADLAADLAAVAADVAAILLDTGTNGVVVASGSKAGYSLAAGGLDAVIVEGSTTFVQAARGWNSVLLAKASGLGTTTAVFRDLADSKARVTATVDADGNRTAITRDLT